MVQFQGNLSLTAATTLQQYLLQHYPNGTHQKICLLNFYNIPENQPIKELIQSRRLIRFCRDFPHLLHYDIDSEQLSAINNTSSFSFKQRNKAVAALKFYKEHLEGNSFLLRACEDRNRFEEELTTWKDLQQQKGIKYIGLSPSNCIYSLTYDHKKLFKHNLGDDTFLVWAEDHKKKSPTTRAQLGREVAQRVIEDRVQLEQNRNGVVIEPITFGIGEDQVAPTKETLIQKVKVYNQSPLDITVKVNDAFARKRNFIVDAPKTQTIPTGHVWHVPVHFTPTVIGIAKTLITFECSSNCEHFSIVRYVSVRSGNPEDYEILKPKSPYQKKKFIERNGFNNVVDLEPGSIQHNSNKFQVPLKPYEIPSHWRSALEDKKDVVVDTITDLYKIPSDVVETISDYSPFLTHGSYPHIFHRLLWTEEAQMEIDIRNYDMVGNTSMTRRGRHWSLYVPGLAESRPSVLKGDKIIVRYTGDKNESYKGVVERVEQEHALISFPGRFAARYVNGVGIDVRFTFKRMNLRTSHRALDEPLTRQILRATFRNQDISFSIPRNVSIGQSQNLAWKNRDLNQEQKAAVSGVLASVARPSPYLIYGPPGTGKTVTVVESILQTLMSSGPSTRMLVSAPSNAAADLLCERLEPYMSPNSMSRIIAYSRERNTVSNAVMKFTHYDNAEGAFVCPPVEELMMKKVVIMTISTSGKNPNIGLNNHFTHVFVDEAGHVTEPELASCFGSAKASAVIVLAGDPKQLGPIIRSEKAKSLGLEMSLLERLSDCEPYQRQNGGYDTRVCTKLVKNYRSHPSILKVPNEMFYDNDLVASADVFRTHAYQNWEHLPKKGFPIIFHGVEGEDRREGNSPSWFNSEEATTVKHYVELLVKGTRTNRCNPEEIGIVTPYHKQVQKIRQLMKAKSYDTKVGSVDEFQGSERRIIIISTVRSSVEHVQFDKKHRLGFVANEKRFNVAITRAQALLIVIGNPYVLQNDRNWCELIRFCKDKGGYTGCDFEFGKENDIDAETDNALKGIASMNLGDESSEDDDSYVNVDPISAMTALEQPEWRIEE